jgi:glutamine synthetase
MTNELEAAIEQIESCKSEFDKADYCADKLLPFMEEVRVVADRLEQVVDRSRWQLPTYLEMLFEH